MAAYLVVCTRRADCPDGGHVTHVGTGPTAGRRGRTWSVAEVWAAIDWGDAFFAARSDAPSAGAALVEKWACGCMQGTLRTNDDPTSADGLDSLPTCADEPA